MRRHKLTIVLSGMMAGDPYVGGATWAVLQYVLGFQQLGHEVLFIEPVKTESLLPTDRSFESSSQATDFRQVVAEFGLEPHAALLRQGTQQTVGLPYECLRQIALRTDLLVNVSGMLTDPELLDPIALRVYLDLDPGFVQLWHDVYGVNMRFAGHTHFVSIGQDLGLPASAVPCCGVPWISTLQPIVLARWPVVDGVGHGALTTVGHWRGYGSTTHEGVFYGQKAHSLREFIELPRRTRERFELALSIHPDETRDLKALAENGWKLLDPAIAAGTPALYQRFIQESKAEFGIAKSGYVAFDCGWFSDRSLCYLASGRPVLAQETGFSRYLPTGEGLLAFETSEDVLSGLDSLGSAYTRHARAAREIAEAYFDSDRVLTRLLGKIGAA